MNALWRRWLVVVSVAIVLFGAISGLGLPMPGQAALQSAITEPFFGGGPIPAGVEGLLRFLLGVLGGVMAGWGIFLIALVRGPLARQERWAWWCVAAGTSVWYCLDTTASARAGVWLNVTGNTVLLVLIAIPLLALAATRRSADSGGNPGRTAS